MKLRSFIFACILLCAFYPAVSQSIPYLSGRVNDYAGMLSAPAKEALELKLKSFEDSTSNQLVILTVNSLDGYPIEDYALKAAETWKIGTKANDNGVLLVIAKEERKVRFEIGYGLEAVLPDGLTGTIMRSHIIPAFKEGNYDRGIIEGMTAVISAIGGEYSAESRESIPKGDIGKLFGGIGFWIILLFILLGRSRKLWMLGPLLTTQGGYNKKYGGWHWGGGRGFGGGGFGGFSGGGGGFGGGGSSGSW